MVIAISELETDKLNDLELSKVEELTRYFKALREKELINNPCLSDVKVASALDAVTEFYLYIRVSDLVFADYADWDSGSSAVSFVMKIDRYTWGTVNCSPDNYYFLPSI
jgi:hypothetical protein